MVDHDTYHASFYGLFGFVWSALQSESLWTAVITSVVCFVAVKLVGGLWNLAVKAVRGTHDDAGKTRGDE